MTIRSSAKPGAYVNYSQTVNPEDVAAAAAAQDPYAASAPVVAETKSWAPWIIGGLVVAGGVYWFTRD